MPFKFYALLQDADSYPKEGSQEKKEGAFCIWQFDEVKELLKEPIQGMISFLSYIKEYIHPLVTFKCIDFCWLFTELVQFFFSI